MIGKKTENRKQKTKEKTENRKQKTKEKTENQVVSK